ncbi:DUF1266 domain-containing protein [Streptomyces cyaneochromogenes]|uniref:DUF1266 domain-containing protein n=1 Tax=Streptomyces cyaneochromogenes TaxID=2496836 RepID=UPI001E2E15BA|nr:DUF1266 domain-containing protein [Streptomyces cyaneochromogenes]
MLDAKSREDWPTYFETLARNRLYFEVRRDTADARFGSALALFEPDPRVVGGMVWAVYTEGMLPAPEPHRAFDWKKFGWLREDWKPDYPTMIVVNPGSPCEAFLPTARPYSNTWAQYAKRTEGPSDKAALRTLRVGGSLQGPVAHGLACGAHLIVHQGRLWNALAYHGHGYRTERRMLRKSWGITSHQEWQVQQHALLATDGANPVWEFALGLRRAIARDFGGYVETGYWRDAAARVLRQRAKGETVLTADGVVKTTPTPAADTETHIKGVQHLIGRIARYEARMRADGILGDGQYVTSADAWDLGRASCMARWGLSTRYCTLAEAEAAVVEAGYSAARCYDSWQDFSAGFILGRCLQFDNEKFGSWYEDMVTVHRILMSDPGSPWLNIPFQ